MSGPQFPKAFFVTGTDTDVGKTLVSAILALGLDAHYWKPIQSGYSISAATDGLNHKSVRSTQERGRPARIDSLDAATCGTTDQLGELQNHDLLTDTELLLDLGIPSNQILKERHKLTQPLSPHLAARLDGKKISLDDFKMPDTSEFKHLIVEGAGGLLVPLNDTHKVIDLIVHLGLPVVLVTRSGLGTINHTLLSLESLRSRQIPILGVVMSGPPNEENRIAIEQFGKATVIAEIPILETINKEALLESFKINFANLRVGAVLAPPADLSC